MPKMGTTKTWSQLKERKESLGMMPRFVRNDMFR